MNKGDIIRILKRNSEADIESEKRAERLVKESLKIYEETKKAI